MADDPEAVRARSQPPADPAAASIADPAPLGLAAFALTTFVLSMFNAGLVDAKGEPIVVGLALAYGGAAQLLAGMWEFRKGNTFGATAFSSYGAFWLSFWAYVAFFAEGIPEGNRGSAVGLYLIAWGIFTTYMWVASLRTNAAVNLVFLLLAITFFVLGIGDAVGNDTISKLGGRRGLVRVVRRGDQLHLRPRGAPRAGAAAAGRWRRFWWIVGGAAGSVYELQ